MMAVDKWRSYLQRGPFVILMDHKSLCNQEEQQLATNLQRKAMSKLVSTSVVLTMVLLMHSLEWGT
jgi:hypothetical protein